MFEKSKELAEKLAETSRLTKEEYKFLIENRTEDISEYLHQKAREKAVSVFGNGIYLRGLIEISSYCKNNCLYCGLRRENKCAERYRLTKEEILDCCERGDALGYKTFVLQGGEDGHFTDDVTCDIVASIREKYPDTAITLSLGERSKESYEKLFSAGANRYLLRHETANECHYNKLHPKEMSPKNRKKSLENLKDIGYQVGCGFMVGSPYQTAENLAEDMEFLSEFNPHMVGIGPFVPSENTPFAKFDGGSLELTLFMVSLTRLTLPRALIPATTALATVDKMGMEKGILAGANVVMPNLSPEYAREKYAIYPGKAHTGSEAAERKKELCEKLKEIGYRIEEARGDYK